MPEPRFGEVWRDSALTRTGPACPGEVVMWLGPGNDPGLKHYWAVVLVESPSDPHHRLGGAYRMFIGYENWVKVD